MPLDWAWTQTALGDALWALGKREKDAALMCAALENHIAAWRVFAETVHYYASEVAREVARDLEVLKRDFAPALYQDWLARYQEVLARMNPVGVEIASDVER